MSVLSLSYLALLSVSAVITIVLARKDKAVTVLLCDLAFLYFLKGNRMDVLYILILSVYTWLAGLFVSDRKKKKGILLVVSALPVLGLVFYKYNGFFMDRIAMPLGLSFYTFKAISYLCDIQRKQCRPRGLFVVFDYLCFFPAFTAGPIHRADAFFTQLDKPFFFDYMTQKNGFLLAALGFFEKLVIADELARLVSLLDAQNAGGWYTVLVTVLYAFEIYVDFDAYSNIAIGSARLLGFDLDRNFNVPYTSASIKEFWNRWHISLSSWLKDYIYIPLGGNRRGLARKYLNTLVVFMVSGIWHGNTMMYLIWGIGHACLNIVEDLLRRACRNIKIPKVFTPLFILINFVLVSILWIFFRSDSMAQAISQLTSIARAAGEPFVLDYTVIGITYNEFVWAGILMVVVIGTDLLRRKWNMLQLLAKQHFVIRWGFYALLILTAIIFGVYGPGYHAENFIYVTF